MPQQNVPLDEAPEVIIDDFDTAGQTKEGPFHARVNSWEYQGPSEGNKGEGQLRLEADIFERPGSGELKEKLWDSFFLDASSLWKLRNLALGCGLKYDGKVGAKQIAKDCIGRDFFGFAKAKWSDKHQRSFVNITKFGCNYAEVTGEATAEGGEEVPF